MCAAHPFASFAVNAAEISYITPAIGFAIGVDELTIEAGLGNAQPVIVAHDWSRVHYEGDKVAVAGFSQKRDDAVICVVKIDPIKSFVDIVELPQGRLVFVNVIQMLHQPTEAVVPRKIEQLPVELNI